MMIVLEAMRQSWLSFVCIRHIMSPPARVRRPIHEAVLGAEAEEEAEEVMLQVGVFCLTVTLETTVSS